MPRAAKTSDKYPKFYMDLAEQLFKGNSVELTFQTIGEATSWRYRFYDFRRALVRENHEFAVVAGGALLKIQPLPDGQALLTIEDMTIKEAHLEAQLRAQLGGHLMVDDLARAARERFLKDNSEIVEVEGEKQILAEDPEETVARVLGLEHLLPPKDVEAEDQAPTDPPQKP